MDQTQVIAQRLGAIEIKMNELSRGVAAVRYRTPGVGRIAMGVALGLFLYSAICLVITVLFWGIIIAGIAGAASRGAGGPQGANQPFALPQQRNR
jgi:hypothetical protein